MRDGYLSIFCKQNNYYLCFADITFDQLVTQCQTALFRYYDSKPEGPLYDLVMIRELCEENAPGLFDLLIRSITRTDSRISLDREALQRQRTVCLIHILSYFRFVFGNLLLRELKKARKVQSTCI